MKISTKSRYGLRAMVYLATSKKICSIKTIAKAKKISSDYLEKIFSKLEKADLVKAKRGAYGGYSLTRSPQKNYRWRNSQGFGGNNHSSPLCCKRKRKGKGISLSIKKDMFDKERLAKSPGHIKFNLRFDHFK